MDWQGGLSIVCTLCSLVLAYFAFVRNRRKDDNDDGKEVGSIMAELGYIKSGIDDVKAEQREQRKINTELVSRLTAVEESAKQAHKRMDRIEKNALD